MPTPQPPLIMVDNVFDRINLYPAATLSSSPAATVGREVQYLADYRRERTFFQGSTATGIQIEADLGAGNTAQVDSIWIDRGHNFWGHSFNSYSQAASEISGGGVTPNFLGRAVPALGTVGGDPTTGWCVTEEGALYTFFTAQPAARFHSLYNADAFVAICPGIVMGKRVQLVEYSSVRDEDASGRTERSQESDAAYLAVDRVYPYRTCTVALDLIGAAEYDASIRYLKATLFDRNQPAVIVMNYGDKPERAWLMQYQGKAWSAPMARVHRKWTGSFREVGALIR